MDNFFSFLSDFEIGEEFQNRLEFEDDDVIVRFLRSVRIVDELLKKKSLQIADEHLRFVYWVKNKIETILTGGDFETLLSSDVEYLEEIYEITRVQLTKEQKEILYKQFCEKFNVEGRKTDE